MAVLSWVYRGLYVWYVCVCIYIYIYIYIYNLLYVRISETDEFSWYRMCHSLLHSVETKHSDTSSM